MTQQSQEKSSSKAVVSPTASTIIAENKIAATPMQIVNSLRKQMKEKKGETYLSVTFARFLFENMTREELTALKRAVETYEVTKREAEIKVLEAKLKALKGE